MKQPSLLRIRLGFLLIAGLMEFFSLGAVQAEKLVQEDPQVVRQQKVLSPPVGGLEKRRLVKCY